MKKYILLGFVIILTPGGVILGTIVLGSMLYRKLKRPSCPHGVIHKTRSKIRSTRKARDKMKDTLRLRKSGGEQMPVQPRT